MLVALSSGFDCALVLDKHGKTSLNPCKVKKYGFTIFNRDQNAPDSAKIEKGNAIFVEINVNRRLVSEIKQVIIAPKFCKSREQLDIESRKVNALKKECGIFCKALCDFNNTEALNQLPELIADKYEQCLYLNQLRKRYDCDRAEND